MKKHQVIRLATKDHKPFQVELDADSISVLVTAHCDEENNISITVDLLKDYEPRKAFIHFTKPGESEQRMYEFQ